MFTKAHSVTVEKVSGGYVIDWQDERRSDVPRNFASNLPKPPTRGREIVTTEKKMLARVKSILT